jgi:putative PIN family toxin of toxin-antitoxin system
MEHERLQLVVDTNTLLRALANPKSASRKVVEACERRKAIVLLSKPLLNEYRCVLTLVLAASSANQITTRDIELLVRRLRYVGHYHRTVRAQFDYPRDPTDSILISLAIDGKETHNISHDRDLLSLPTARTDAGKRFRQRLPHVAVVEASTLLREHPWLRE